MDIDENIFNIRYNNIAPEPGKLLVAEPFLRDFPFCRSVTLLVNHTAESSMGIILNMPIPQSLNELIPEFNNFPEIPLFRGGPLGGDILFFLHTYKDIPEALPIVEGLYLNGDFQVMKSNIINGNIDPKSVRFFLGYTGWGPGQLEFELKQNTWLITRTSVEYIINQSPYTLWKDTMNSMGEKYQIWTRFPINPFNN